MRNLYSKLCFIQNHSWLLRFFIFFFIFSLAYSLYFYIKATIKENDNKFIIVRKILIFNSICLLNIIYKKAWKVLLQFKKSSRLLIFAIDIKFSAKSSIFWLKSLKIGIFKERFIIKMILGRNLHWIS